MNASTHHTARSAARATTGAWLVIGMPPGERGSVPILFCLFHSGRSSRAGTPGTPGTAEHSPALGALRRLTTVISVTESITFGQS